jgi:hypothetical protein
MMRIELQEQKLDRLFQEVSNLQEEEIKAHLAKYLCINASGYLENVIKELISEYHKKTCKQETERFVNSKVRRLTNIDDKTLTDFLNIFNEQWTIKYAGTISDEQRSSLDSIIAQRNLIAHGNASISNISFNNMQNYYIHLKEIVSFLKTIIKK